MYFNLKIVLTGRAMHKRNAATNLVDEEMGELLDNKCDIQNEKLK